MARVWAVDRARPGRRSAEGDVPGRHGAAARQALRTTAPTAGVSVQSVSHSFGRDVSRPSWDAVGGCVCSLARYFVIAGEVAWSHGASFSMLLWLFLALCRRRRRRRPRRRCCRRRSSSSPSSLSSSSSSSSSLPHCQQDLDMGAPEFEFVLREWLDVRRGGGMAAAAAECLPSGGGGARNVVACSSACMCAHDACRRSVRRADTLTLPVLACDMFVCAFLPLCAVR